MRGHVHSGFQRHLGCIVPEAGGRGVIGQLAENGSLQSPFGPAVAADMIAGLSGALRIVVPAIEHDQRRHAEAQRLAKAFIAAVVDEGWAPRVGKACAMPMQFSAAPEPALENSAMVGLALRVNSSSSIRPADHAEQCGSLPGRLRPPAAGEAQVDAKQIGTHFISPVVEMVECIEVLAQRLLRPEDVDA
ncbi:hypothetical protein LB554_19860 [Mesorhizobium sp. CO1-1-11]|nr:hypothetical protein [Mesorhizobium sp. CO1-1-11]MBZ9726200.1 hypothetical protein [Mesorhizobium sp. CO1-1-11]